MIVCDSVSDNIYVLNDISYTENTSNLKLKFSKCIHIILSKFKLAEYVFSWCHHHHHHHHHHHSINTSSIEARSIPFTRRGFVSKSKACSKEMPLSLSVSLFLRFHQFFLHAEQNEKYI